MYFKACSWRFSKKIFSISATLWLLCSASAIAAPAKPQPQGFPVNPLEIKTDDPLLPSTSPPTVAEQQKLASALDELERQALAKLQAGDKLGAFELWNRELRLRRVLGLLPETQALGRVGAIAWSENERLQVQFITERLNTIWQQTKTQTQPDLQFLSMLGYAFQQVRVPKSAIDVYTQILSVQRQQQNSAAIETTLQTMAELHLSWFDYPQAIASFNELLKLATASGDRPKQLSYLQQLSYIYDRAKQRQESISTKQQLITLYQQQNLLTDIPPLHLAIASDYESLGQLQEAFTSYQLAYTSAWALQQFFQAGDALRRLISLYSSQGQTEEALQASQILLQADEQAVNTYGMMNTYDRIGQINFKLGRYPEALSAFQNGLELAKQLQYQEEYFSGQIAQVNQRIPK